LELNPRNPELHHNLGLCLAAQRNFAEAARHQSEAMRWRAEYADAQFDLGNALAGLGRFDEAISNYTAVLRLNPTFAAAHLRIANALIQQGKPGEATPHFLGALRLDPRNAEAHCAFALSLAGQGKNAEALAEFSEALRLKPNEAQFHFHTAGLLEAERRPHEALEQYHEAVRLKPDSVFALNNLAWMLATHEDATIRNGAEAVKFAERACELTGRQEAFLMGTLAAAYAEAGRFSEAVGTAHKAIELATAAGQKELAATNQRLLELYQAGKTYRDGQAKR
jgi:tetratricopeptide (TPR) repeat protein